MRKILSCLLILFLVVGGIIISTDQVSADNGKGNGKGGKIPYGIAKKFMYEGLQNLFQVRSITRAQAAYMIAEKADEDYKDFDNEKDIIEKITDYKAIPSKYRKAVAFVVSEELMPYTTLPNGKILFQGNKTISWNELAWILKYSGDSDDPDEEAKTTIKGTVRIIEKIGGNTWIVIANGDGLRTAYFPSGQVPEDLTKGIYIEVKTVGSKILESSLGTNQTSQLKSLVFSVITSPSAPEAGEATTLLPRLINTSQTTIKLQNTQYRFTLQKINSTSKWDFQGRSSQDLTIRADNSSNPTPLVKPTSLWTPPSAGEYRIVRAQLKVNNGEWQNIKYQQNAELVNLLTENQSNVETDTTGFAAYGQDLYAGASLSRVTKESWQGSSSLRVTTNGYNDWQGVNLNYKGTALSGQLAFSFYVKAEEGTPLKVRVYDNTNDSYPSGGSLVFTATGSWQRKTVLFTPQKATRDVYLQIYLNNSDVDTSYYLDGMQLERGSKVTSWVPGGSTSDAIYVSN